MADNTALITGATGQDGAYLVKLLLEKGYEVHGVKRRASSSNTGRVDDLNLDSHEHNTRYNIHHGDLTDAPSLIRVIQETTPSEIYNLGAQSHVRVSFDVPEYTADTNALGTLRLLEAMRILEIGDQARYYQASTSELFGNAGVPPHNESTPFAPRSPYGVAKLFAYWMTVNYRDGYNFHASNGILFNHESPIRGETFVTRKISRAVAAIELGQRQCLHVGNLDAERDWGHARDYVEGMWMMLQQIEPDDYVLATGESRTVRQFIERAFAVVDREIDWRGSGEEEQGLDRANGNVLVAIDPRYFRPTEVDCIWGDASKARTQLGWRPLTTFDDLVREMVEADLENVKKEFGP